MHCRPPYRAAGDRVYRAIKARLVAFEFPQGRRIYLEPLAESLGVSTTPVREAMNRLAERELVIKAENKGFFAMTLTEARLRGNYDLTRQLLILGLKNLTPAAERAMASYVPAADLVNKLNRRVIADVGTLARYTGDVFSAIAAITENSAVQQTIDLANDHLYFIRMLECRHIQDTQSELKRFCELLLSGEGDQLVAAIDEYHKERLAQIPHLLRDQTR
jgi:DNA-binding GntR family transcriptional regulator